MTAACEGYLQYRSASSVSPAGPFLTGTQELLSHAAGQSKVLLDVLACLLLPDGPSCVWLQTRAKDARFTADLAVSFCFLNRFFFLFKALFATCKELLLFTLGAWCFLLQSKRGMCLAQPGKSFVSRDSHLQQD